MTNFEKIKAMSVEELAKAMCDTFDCKYYPVAKVDNLFFDVYCPANPGDGWKLLIELLQQEVEE